MRAVLLLAVVGVAAFTACGGGAVTPPRPIRFGLAGGNILSGGGTSIEPDGSVTITKGLQTSRRKIPVERVRQLGREIQHAQLPRRRICPGTLPDIASQYIRLGGTTFRLRGSCEPRFERVWTDLLRAVGQGPK